MKSSMALAVITILAAVFSVVFAGISAYYARQANRTTGFLEISARYGVKDVYDISQMPEENTIIPGKLFNAPPPIIRQDHGLHIDIRNTGRYQEQVVKIGFTLENHERIEFQSPDPQGIRRMPPEIKHRLPFTVQSGESRQFFWAFNIPEYEQYERMTEVWFETARETVSIKIRK